MPYKEIILIDLNRNSFQIFFKLDNKEKEPLAEDPAHLCSTPMQLDTKDEEDKETIGMFVDNNYKKKETTKNVSHNVT